MNRRSILGVLGGAPFAAKAVAREVISSGSIAPPASLYQGSQAGIAGASNPINPLMERSHALRTIFADAKAIAEMRDELFEQHRFIPSIDPDIAIMRSWSDMAKITFQRQRNVERAWVELQEARLDRPGRYLRALEERLQKLMWGQ
jgi:hypothetical protein